MAHIYRAQVADLRTALSDEDCRAEAAQRQVKPRSRVRGLDRHGRGHLPDRIASNGLIAASCRVMGCRLRLETRDPLGLPGDQLCKEGAIGMLMNPEYVGRAEPQIVVLEDEAAPDMAR
jgi:hypothetical protein